MAHLFGVCNQYPIYNTGTNPRVPATSAGLPGLVYRRTDDHHTAFSNQRVDFTRYFNPSGTGLDGLEFAENQSEGENGDIKTVTVSRVVSNPADAGFREWGVNGEANVLNDPRISYSLSQSVSTLDFLPEVPAHRVVSTQLFVDATYATNPFVGISWYFKEPLPLDFAFSFENGIYKAKASVRFNKSATSTDYAGRFVHDPQYYFAGGIGGMDAVDGTIFPTYEAEKAYNSNAFQLGPNDPSTTFSETFSVASFPETVHEGTLIYNSNSEGAGAHSGRAFFPVIVRPQSNFEGEGRIRVDISKSVSPTAKVTGAVVLNGAVGSALQPVPSIDHFEVDGQSYPAATITSGLGYLPSPVFDIVLDDAGSQAGWLTIYAIVDTEAFDLSGAALELSLNYLMSVPALLQVSANPSGGSARFIVRASGEIKSRPKSQLWQHPGTARIYAHEPATGAILTSDDEGATYQLMANAWSDVSGAKPIMADSLGDAGGMSIARVGSDLKFRSSADNETWDAPVTVCPYGTGGWCVREHLASGEALLTISNMNDTTLQSHDTGMTWGAV